MSRLSAALLVVAGVSVGALATVLLRPGLDEAAVRDIAAEVVAEAPAPAPGLDEAAVRELVASLAAETPSLDRTDVEQIVGDALSDNAAISQPAAFDADALNPMIESYLLQNPSILQRVSAALTAEVEAAETAERTAALTELHDVIYNDADHIVLGNPEGDVTLVEMFDYNCTYCRQALPDLATLLAEDPDLRVILKEFPILSADSVDAARIGVLVGQADNVNYWDFHQALFSSRGRVNKDSALKVATDLGLNPVSLQLDMESPDVRDIIQRSYQIADGLKISGTPTFIIGNEVIPGAIGLSGLKQRIANMRECGETTCPAVENTPG